MNKFAQAMMEATEQAFDKAIDVKAIEQVAFAYNESLEALMIDNEFLNKIGLSARNIYCSKTGQIIGQHSDRALAIALNHFGENRLEDLAKYISANTPAWHWYDTSSDALNKLMRSDPYGYFVYIASIALRCNAKGFNGAKANKQWETMEDEFNFNRSKIALWHMLQNIPVDLIIEANIGWQMFLSQFSVKRIPQIVTFPYNNLIDLGRIEVIEGIAQNLKRVASQSYIHDEWVRSNVRSANQLREKFPYMQQHFGAAPNVAGQTRLKGESSARFMERLLTHDLLKEEVIVAPTKLDYKLANNKLEKHVETNKSNGTGKVTTSSHPLLAKLQAAQKKVQS